MGRVVLTVLSVAFFCIAIFFPATKLAAIELECAPEGCGPAPGSSGYAGAVRARVIPQNSRGSNGPFGAESAPGGTENNLGSQSYNYAISILHLPGRNGLNLSLTLHYNSRIWEIDRINTTAILNADRDFPSYGFRLDFGFLEYNDSDNVFILTEADGSKRRLVAAGSIYVSDDSSFIDYDSTSRVLRYKNGLQVHFEQYSGSGFTNFYKPTKVQDTNGNRITIAYNTSNRITTITDTLDRMVTYNYTDGLLTSITQTLFGGGTKTWATFGWNTSQQLTYNFTAGSFYVVAEGNTTGSPIQPAGSTIKALVSCTYPNGTGYRFVYGPNGDWGVVHKIENLSASNPQQVRSSIAYNFPAGSTSHSDAPAYTQQTIFDGVNSAVYEYSVAKNSSGLVSSYSVTEPSWAQRTKMVTTLFAAGDWRDGLVSTVEVLKVSDNSLLRMVSNDWTADPTTNKNARVCRMTSTLADTNQQYKVELLYAGESTPCIAAATTNGNVSRQDEYDFGLLLKRRTETTFATSSTHPNLTNRHMLDRPTQILLKDASNAIVARTDMDYDTTAVAGISGTATGHDSPNFGTGFTFRGNLTKVTRYSNAAAATGPIDRFFNYDMVGNLVTADLDCCNKKQFTFSSTTQFAFPDSITRGPVGGPQLSTSATYNLNTGNVNVSTDENGKNTTFTFDSMNRSTNVERPDGADFTTSFDDQLRQIKVTTTTPIDSTQNRISVVTVDGKVTLQETKDGSSNLISTVKTERDDLGRVEKVSNPYGPSETPIFTTTTYDALSRPVTVAPPSQGTQSFEYSGNKVKVTDPAGKQRRHITDAFGRLVQVDEPGSAGASTVTISGSTQMSTIAATSGTGSVTINSYNANGSVQREEQF